MTKELAELSDGIRTLSYQKNAKVAPIAIAVGYVVVSAGKRVSKNILRVNHVLILTKDERYSHGDQVGADGCQYGDDGMLSQATHTKQ
jgi:hypothetical protein